MSLSDLELKRSYITFGEDGIASSLISPALTHACRYDRSVGFFSSSVLKTITPGIISFYRRKGHIRLICSPKLSQSDIQAIDAGYQTREAIIQNSFENVFETELQEFDDESLQLLYQLIAKEALDIRIAFTDTEGFYHDKMGLMYDEDGNAIAFYGSANSSENGYTSNYERIRVVRSWVSGEREFVNDERREFENLWKGLNPYVKVIRFRESAERKLLEVIERRTTQKNTQSVVKLRPYQEEAISAWVQNKHHGFFVMATGTGKTWTAIYAAKRLVEKNRAIVVICAPYKHLVKQWAIDVRGAFPDAKLILVSSENHKWEQQLNEAIIQQRYDPNYQVIVISTIISFNLERFRNIIGKTAAKRLLIVDEAHRFNHQSEYLQDEYQYMLGLSATPFGGRSTEKGDALMAFFGGCVYQLPIEKALGKFLVNYYYHPIFVQATAKEEERFRSYTSKIMGCYRNGVLIDRENLVKHLRNRLRVIAMAENKIRNLGSILENISEKDHLVVYCGDGRLFDDNRQKELRHIQYVKAVLDQYGYRASQFTSAENMDTRMELVDAFNKGEITSLAAIRCLDEGINIPSIKGALLLASNDDYREFVQRRGRILRQYGDKKDAHIYDVILLPSEETPGMATIELRRYLEYAHLALNSDELLINLEHLLARYGLTKEDIAMITAETEEVELDE